MSKQLDRARENHRALVKQHGRLSTRKDLYIRNLTRTQKQLGITERAIARSQKRLDKLMAAATHTAGPTASPVRDLIEAVDDKEISFP